MAKSSRILSKLDSLLATDYKNANHTLEEPQENMSIGIDSGGLRFLSYSYDKQEVDEQKKNVLPFLAKRKNVHAMCDYIIFCQENGKLFVLLIELKKGKQEVMSQMKAAECLVNYIIATLNRVEKMEIIPEIRKISVRSRFIQKKGPCRPKEVVYDENRFHTFDGRIFHLRRYLH